MALSIDPVLMAECHAAMHWLITIAPIVGLVLAFLTGRGLRKGDE